MWRSHGRWPRVEQIWARRRLRPCSCRHAARLYSLICSREDHETGVVVDSGACGRYGGARRSYRGGSGTTESLPACHRLSPRKTCGAASRSRRHARDSGAPGLGAGPPMARRKLRARARLDARALGAAGSSAAGARRTARTQATPPHERSTVARYTLARRARGKRRRRLSRHTLKTEISPWPTEAWVESRALPAAATSSAARCCRIGREADNDIRLSAKTVHRYHAVDPPHDRRRCDDHGPVAATKATACSSTASRVDEARLKKGDIINVGEVKMHFDARARLRRLQASRGWKRQRHEDGFQQGSLGDLQCREERGSGRRGHDAAAGSEGRTDSSARSRMH